MPFSSQSENAHYDVIVVGASFAGLRLYGLFASPEGHKILQSALLETPIIGMDSNFFGLLRNLLGKHPRIYRSALQAVWQRVTTSTKVSKEL